MLRPAEATGAVLSTLSCTLSGVADLGELYHLELQHLCQGVRALSVFTPDLHVLSSCPPPRAMHVHNAPNSVYKRLGPRPVHA